MSNYVTVYLDKEPTEEECEKFYSDPVHVIDDEGEHWEVLVVQSEYDKQKLTAKPFAVHSTCDKKYLKADDKPRHVFGSPGNTNDPETMEVEE